METTLEMAKAPAPTQLPPDAALFQLIFGKVLTYSVTALARLGVADHMGEEPAAVEDLAAASGAHPGALYRVLRMLAGFGLFVESAGRRFHLTPAGRLLRSDAEGSLRNMAIMAGDPWITRAYQNLPETLRTGRDGVSIAFGKHAFELFPEIPDQLENFQRAMTDFTAIASEALLQAYDCSGIRRLADVGGGHGTLLGHVLRRHPSMEGVLFDLPEVLAGAEASGELTGCQGRIHLEAGSFLERVPAGCDAYILKHIIHDWDEVSCRRILGFIREQLAAHAPDGRVLVYEMVIPEGPEPVPSKILDIEMLAATPGGRERTAGEFDDLFQSAGLKLERIVPTASPMCVIEGRVG